MKNRYSLITYIFIYISLSLILTNCKKSIQDQSFDYSLIHLTGHGEATTGALQGTSYTFVKLFDVPSTENQQGLAFGAGSHFVTFDIGGGQARIVEYNSSGTQLKRTGGMALGHSAEASYRQSGRQLVHRERWLVWQPYICLRG